MLARRAALVAGVAVPLATWAGTLPEAGPANPVPEALVARPWPDGPNPYVLTDLVSGRLVLEVDWVAGARPSPRALGAAETFLREHCTPGRGIEIVEDDEIPRPAWEAARGRAGIESLVARFLDRDPGDWRRAELVHVLYVPDAASWYPERPSGMTDRVAFARGGEVAVAQVVLVFADEVRRDAVAWIGPTKIERAILIHELGHVMGLVPAAADHVQEGQPGHCSAARCVMHRPGARAAWVNGLPAFLTGRIPSRLDRSCARDIEEALRRWAERARDDAAGFAQALVAARLLHADHAASAWRARQNDP